jgi:hypothetical protein
MATIAQPPAGQPMFVPPAGNQVIYYHPQMAGGAVIMVRDPRTSPSMPRLNFICILVPGLFIKILLK